MSLADDLLEQARHLAQRDVARPKQASLRRALSTAYYALFHLLVDGSRRFLLGGGARNRHLRDVLARCYEHKAMNDASKSFGGGTSPWLAAGTAVSQELRDVARTFAHAQRNRHAADYDLGRVFTRGDVLSEVARIERAFALWEQIEGQDDAKAFMLALLLRARSS